MTLTFGESFSGIGGASLAWQGLGWSAAWCSEIAPFPAAVHAHHYPDVPHLGDVHAITRETADPIDVLVGGPPCQDFSVAGPRAGLAGARGALLWQYLRLAQEFRPRWVVFENVPGILSSHEGEDWATFLGALAERGYHAAWRVLDAQYDGLAQRRERVYLVGYLGDWRPAAAVLAECEGMSGHAAPSRGEGEGVAGTLAARTGGGGGLGTDFECDGGLRVTAFNHQSGGDMRLGLNAETANAVQRSQGQAICFSSKDSGQDAGEVVPTLRAMGHAGSHANGGGQVAVALSPTITGGPPFSRTGNERTEADALVWESRLARNGRGVPGDLVPPLKAQSGGSGRGDGAPLLQSAESGVRRLTPRECERAQGYQDDWTRIPWCGKPAEDCPDSPRYKAIGNAFVVPTVRWIGEQIAAVEAMTAQPGREREGE